MIRWQGKTIDFDIDTITVDELREIKRKYKFTGRQFIEGLQDIDPDAFTCLYWVVMRRGGDTGLVLGDDISFPLIEFASAWAEAQEEPEPDPTRDGSRPGTATLQPSGSSPRM